MGTRCVVLALVMLPWWVTNCSGQAVDSKERNSKYFDSIKQAVETYYCDGNLKYPETYDKKEVNKVISTLKLLNFIANNDITARQVDSALSKTKFKIVDEDDDLNGLLKTTTVKAVLEYLSVTIKFVYADGFLITKKITLIPKTTVRCSNYGSRLPDLKMLTDVYVKYIDFPIRMVDLSYILMKKFDPDNLGRVSVQHKEYKFFSNELSGPKTDWVYRLFLKQYDPDSSCCYSYIEGEADMIRLIKEERYDVIRDLVFSPNYFFAINAMEAVLYLSGAGKLQLNDQMKEKILELKTKVFKIKVRRAPDVLGPVDGYRSINTSDEAVLRKYQRSL